MAGIEESGVKVVCELERAAEIGRRGEAIEKVEGVGNAVEQ